MKAWRRRRKKRHQKSIESAAKITSAKKNRNKWHIKTKWQAKWRISVWHRGSSISSKRSVATSIGGNNIAPAATAASIVAGWRAAAEKKRNQ